MQGQRLGLFRQTGFRQWNGLDARRTAANDVGLHPAFDHRLPLGPGDDALTAYRNCRLGARSEVRRDPFHLLVGQRALRALGANAKSFEPGDDVLRLDPPLFR